MCIYIIYLYMGVHLYHFIRTYIQCMIQKCISDPGDVGPSVPMCAMLSIIPFHCGICGSNIGRPKSVFGECICLHHTS